MGQMFKWLYEPLEKEIKDLKKKKHDEARVERQGDKLDVAREEYDQLFEEDFEKAVFDFRYKPLRIEVDEKKKKLHLDNIKEGYTKQINKTSAELDAINAAQQLKQQFNNQHNPIKAQLDQNLAQYKKTNQDEAYKKEYDQTLESIRVHNENYARQLKADLELAPLKQTLANIKTHDRKTDKDRAVQDFQETIKNKVEDSVFHFMDNSFKHIQKRQIQQITNSLNKAKTMRKIEHEYENLHGQLIRAEEEKVLDEMHYPQLQDLTKRVEKQKEESRDAAINKKADQLQHDIDKQTRAEDQARRLKEEERKIFEQAKSHYDNMNLLQEDKETYLRNQELEKYKQHKKEENIELTSLELRMEHLQKAKHNYDVKEDGNYDLSLINKVKAFVKETLPRLANKYHDVKKYNDIVEQARNLKADMKIHGVQKHQKIMSMIDSDANSQRIKQYLANMAELTRLSAAKSYDAMDNTLRKSLQARLSISKDEFVNKVSLPNLSFSAIDFVRQLESADGKHTASLDKLHALNAPLKQADILNIASKSNAGTLGNMMANLNAMQRYFINHYRKPDNDPVKQSVLVENMNTLEKVVLANRDLIDRNSDGFFDAAIGRIVRKDLIDDVKKSRHALQTDREQKNKNDQRAVYTQSANSAPVQSIQPPPYQYKFRKGFYPSIQARLYQQEQRQKFQHQIEQAQKLDKGRWQNFQYSNNKTQVKPKSKRIYKKPFARKSRAKVKVNKNQQ